MYRLKQQKFIPATALLVTLTLLFTACSASTGNSSNLPFTQGKWYQPVLGSYNSASVSSTAFAAANPEYGYACVSTLQSAATPGPQTPAASATSAATATQSPTAQASPSATAALASTGTAAATTPTALPTVTQSQITNTFWSTTTGGLYWNPVTLPATIGSFICPLSAVSAPNPQNPLDVFLLAAQGTFDVNNPFAFTPGQLQFQLWRSQDGGQTWKQLTTPTSVNSLQPLILSPYHLIIQVQGSTIVFANNYVGSQTLFVSYNSGQTWVQQSLNSVDSFAPLSFAGFADGPNNSLWALVSSSDVSQTNTPYQIYQTNDFGQLWSFVTSVPIGAPIPSGANAQLFTGANAQYDYVVTQVTPGTATAPTATTIAPTASAAASPTATATTPSGTSGAALQTALYASSNTGVTWSKNIWPDSVSGTPLGGAQIAQFGVNFAVDSRGYAYAAPTNSDNSPLSDPSAANSAGIYVFNGSSAALFAQTPATSTVMTMSLGYAPQTNVQNPQTPTPLPSATATEAVAPTTTASPPPIVAPTGTVTATGTASATAVTSPTATVTASSVYPVLWVNFGPPSLFIASPSEAGFMGYISETAIQGS